MIKNILKLVRGDITQLKVDAIVNAANTTLLGGGSVDGAIHHAAGPDLLKECATLNGCPTGQAKITKGYRLPAKYVIHAVGPIWHDGTANEPELLASCYRCCFKLAHEYGIKTIAFPAISCGIYGYPKSQAALIAVKAATDYLKKHQDLTAIYFVCFEDSVYSAYQKALDIFVHE